MWVLRQKNVDEHVIKVIKSSYENCTTSIEMDGKKSPVIEMKIGVKQGDPMSPLLFNLAMDPLINALELMGQGYTINGNRLATLAFADDLVLVSESWDGMEKNLAILESFCSLSGLVVQAKKCYGFLLTPTHDSYTVNNCRPWNIMGNELNMIAPGDSEHYLGTKIDPWVGIVKADMIHQLQEWIGRIDQAPLKPSQKLVILRTYTIPRLIYLADHTDCKVNCLKVVDTLMRAAVKKWLHLPTSICDGIIYSRIRDGGLGVLRLASLIPSIQIRRLQRIADSSDRVIRSLATTEKAQEELQKLWTGAGGTVESTPNLRNPSRLIEPPGGDLMQGTTAQKPKYLTPTRWRQDEFLTWCGLPVQGMGVQVFWNDPISNNWLRTQHGMQQKHFIAALQLRANVYPTREALNRGRMGTQSSCRKCSARLETCSHILGQCPSVQGARIARHNKLCNMLADEASILGWRVYKEANLRNTEGELRKPDLIFTKSGRSLVIDITIRFEYAADTLENAAKEKVQYYSVLERQIKNLTSSTNIKFFGFPMGARGKWPSINNTVLAEMGIPEKRRILLAKLFSRRTLLYSLDILAMFCGNSAVYEQSS